MKPLIAFIAVAAALTSTPAWAQQQSCDVPTWLSLMIFGSLAMIPVPRLIGNLLKLWKSPRINERFR
jgi:hypothetical protein